MKDENVIVEYLVGRFLHETEVIQHAIPEGIIIRESSYGKKLTTKPFKKIRKTQEWNQIRSTWSKDV